MTEHDETDTEQSEQTLASAVDTAIAAGGSNYKVLGETPDSDGTGVVGRATSATGTTCGVYGETQSSSDTATGVKGVASATSGRTYGVHGKSQSDSLNAFSVFADARGANADALRADATGGSYGDAVHGIADNNGYWGLWGEHQATSGGQAYGVYAETASSDAPALYATGNGGGALETSGDVSVTGDVNITGTLPKSTGGAEVSLSSNQSIPSNSYTRIEYDSVVTERGNEFDTSNNEFTCQYDGNYHVDASVAWQDLDAGTYTIVQLRLNGSTVGKEHAQAGQGGFQSTPKSKTLLDLSAGDTITVDAWQNSGGSETLSGSSGREYTTLTIAQIG